MLVIATLAAMVAALLAAGNRMIAAAMRGRWGNVMGVLLDRRQARQLTPSPAFIISRRTGPMP